MSVFVEIQQIVEAQRKLPEMIMIPRSMFDEFAADVLSTGHAETVWGRPVVPGDVCEITLLWAEPSNPGWSATPLARLLAKIRDALAARLNPGR